MAIQTVTKAIVTEWQEALYLLYSDPGLDSIPQEIQRGKMVWVVDTTNKNVEKALKELEQKKSPLVPLDFLTEQNLAKIGVSLSTGKKAARKITKARKKPGGGTRRRLSNAEKSFILKEAKKGGKQAAIKKAFEAKYGWAPSYATFSNYVKQAKG